MTQRDGRVPTRLRVGVSERTEEQGHRFALQREAPDRVDDVRAEARTGGREARAQGPERGRAHPADRPQGRLRVLGFTQEVDEPVDLAKLRRETGVAKPLEEGRGQRRFAHRPHANASEHEMVQDGFVDALDA